MASELTVQTLRGPTSGANADTVLIPSGQTLDASEGFTPPAGHTVQHQYLKRQADISTSSNTWVNINNITFTPLYANSLLELSLNYSLGRNQQDIRWRFYDTTASSQIDMTSVVEFKVAFRREMVSCRCCSRSSEAVLIISATSRSTLDSWCS